jgi:hypothetical protein
MTIDDFIAGAQASLLAFKHAYQEQMKTDSTFYPTRSESDWWREVAAYHAYVELEEDFKQAGEN